MFLRGDYWHYDFIVNGIRYRGSTGFKKGEKSKATEVVQKLKIQLREKQSLSMIWEQTKKKMSSGNELPLTADDIRNAVNKKHIPTAGDARQKVNFTILKTFCTWMHKNYPQVKTAGAVTHAHAQEWIVQVFSAPGAPATKNAYLVTLKMFFSRLGEEYGIVENPFAKIDKLPNSGASREAFSPEELALIGKNATGWIYSLCLTAISTGLREGDICLMRKDSVNLSTGWITLTTRKTKTRVEIPILPGLRKHLENAVKANPDSEYVYPDLAKIYTTSKASIGHGIKDFFEKIGISDAKKQIDGYKKNVSVKDVHSFRHTFVYLAAVSGVPFPIVQGIVGHASQEMTKHYMDHAGREAKARYLQQLPDYLTGNTKTRDPKKLSPDRVITLIQNLTPDNIERNKTRLIALLRKL